MLLKMGIDGFRCRLLQFQISIGLGNFGMKLDVQLIMETQYRCRACEHSWSVTAPET